MMLRSSSTPILGSLVSSCSDSPNNNNHHYRPELSLTPNRLPPKTHNKVSIHHSPLSQNLTCNSSPSINNYGFRRAQSDSNLASLARTPTHDDDTDFSFSTPSKTRQHHSSLLETIPSFSFHNSGGRFEDDDEFTEEEEEEEEEAQEDKIDEYGYFLDNPIKAQGRFEAPNLDMEKKIMALNQQMTYGNVVLNDMIENPASKMFLSKGLGVETGFDSGVGGNSGGGGNFTAVYFGKGGNGGEGHDTEEHYKRMVNANPRNPLFLRNYAQFLHQSKKDLNGAEEYYSRAILADPNDGEILSQYANILWELHHDKDRATSYYERAVQAASEDSHVHAAYASFLWEIEDEDEDEAPNSSHAIPPLHIGAMTSATVAVIPPKTSEKVVSCLIVYALQHTHTRSIPMILC